MRKHRPKISLHFKDGVEIQSMKDLRENFDLKRLIDYFQNGKLSEWLLNRLYENEAEELKKLNPDDKDFAEKLCNIFDVDFDEVAEQLDDPETIAWRNERRERLKKFTQDKTILRQIDNVAFNQEDLEDIILDEVLPEKIYLCGKRFVFPSGILNKENISYVGIGNDVVVEIDSNKEVDFDALNISFENISFDEAYKKVSGIQNNTEQPIYEIFQQNNPDNFVQKNESENIVLHKEPEKTQPEEYYERRPAYFERTTTIKNSAGVHAMPATLLVKTADKFKSQVSISAKGKKVNAKNILVIMSMGLLKGTDITVSAYGFDAEAAVNTLIELIDNKFGED